MENGVDDEAKEKAKRIETRNEYQVSISGEDHTLLNLLRYTMSKKCEDVELCGYNIPHPSENVAVFRVQFKDERQQNADNVYRAIVDGLERVKEIGAKLLHEIDAWDAAQPHEGN